MMNILIAPNNYYVMPSIVLLQSLFDVTEEQLDIYMIHDSKLLDENLNRLKKLIHKHGGKFHPIVVSSQLFGEANVSGHITQEAYYRLLAQDLLPHELDRVLYLDADIIVTRSLQGFYDMPFEDSDGVPCYYVVCEGPGVSKRVREVYDRLGIPYEYPYFNSGVLLMNLSLLRENYDTQNLMEYIHRKGNNLNYHDQDVLNALFYDKVKYVDWHIYNQTILHIADRNEAKIRLDKARIIHYAGPDKPWNYTYSSWYFNEFWKNACRAGYGSLYLQTMIRRLVYMTKRRLAWFAERVWSKLAGKG